MVNACTKALQSWLLQNGLCLNPEKSEAILVGTRFQLQKVDCVSVKVADCDIPLRTTMRNLGVVIDNKLSLDQHVDALCRSAQFHIRALRHIRGSLSTEVARCVAASIVGSRLDYCNGSVVRSDCEKHSQASACAEHSCSGRELESQTGSCQTGSQESSLVACK